MPKLTANAELLAALSRVLSRRRLRWYVFGAQAVVLFGEPRMTGDVDVTVEVALDKVPSLVTAIEKSGFVLRVQDWAEFFARTRVVPLVHKKTHLPLDLVVSGPGLEARFLGRVRRVDIGGVKVPVIAPEDLVAVKLLAQRPRDLDDVRGILREQGPSLDLTEIRKLLQELEALLDRSDLVQLLNRLVKATTRAE